MENKKDDLLDPECQSCGEPNCADCTQFGAHFLLTDPVFPWPSPDGKPIRQPETPAPWETLPWAKK